MGVFHTEAVSLSAKEFLQQLSEASGVSGYEHTLRDLVTAAFRPYAAEISITPMGSIIAFQRGTRDTRDRTPAPKVLIEGHMDEIGLMITDIEKGFLRFTGVGGFDARVLLGQEVVVHGKRDLRGIIGSRPPHVLSPEERERVIPMNQLFIDVGLSEAAVRQFVQPGDLVTIARKMVSLENNLVAGKAFDDRAAVVCVAQALRQLHGMKHMWDVYAVANVQEEVGLKGAATSAYQINPDVAIAIDVSHAEQPNTSPVGTIPLDGGMGIAVGPNIHPLILERLTQSARDHEIPFVEIAEPGPTGTNAWAMQIMREGVPTGLIEIPLRYMHTSVETVSLGDLERIGRLLADFCASLDEGFARELKGEVHSTAEKPAAHRPRPAGRTRARAPGTRSSGRGTRRK